MRKSTSLVHCVTPVVRPWALHARAGQADEWVAWTQVAVCGMMRAG